MGAGSPKFPSLGGEPTLHPLLTQFIDTLHDRLYPKHVAHLQIDTNALLPLPEALRGRPYLRVVRNRPNSKAKKNHRCQWLAPIDMGQELAYCQIPRMCGYCLGAFGYSPCGAGGAIARLFNFPQFLTRDYPAEGDTHFRDFRELLCSLCQRGAKTQLKISDPAFKGKSPISPSFQTALDRWHENPPKWPRFGEEPDL